MDILTKKRAVILAVISTFTATVFLCVGLLNVFPRTREEQILQIIKNKYAGEVDEDEVLNYSAMAMLAALDDPYSVFLSAEDYTGLMESIEGEYSGVGIEVNIDPEDSRITVLAVFEGSPGDLAGIAAGDKLIKVDEMEVGAENYVDAIRYMRGMSEEGAENPEMDITVYRPSGDEYITMNITRSKVKMETVKHADYGDAFYIRITGFDTPTAADFREAMAHIDQERAKGIIIDVRDNPGGTLRSVVEIADILMGEGNIVYTEDKNGKRNYYNSGKSSVQLPIVVLVNENSASASEILAGAIKDSGTGVLVGGTTFGKGSVQEIIPLRGEGALKITTSHYFTPSGVSINKIGIQPDYKVNLSPEASEKSLRVLTEDEDAQLQKALELVRAGLIFRQ